VVLIVLGGVRGCLTDLEVAEPHHLFVFPILNPIQIKLESPENRDRAWWEIRRSSTIFHSDAIFG
jgi:hypothetical protein